MRKSYRIDKVITFEMLRLNFNVSFAHCFRETVAFHLHSLQFLSWQTLFSSGKLIQEKPVNVCQ